MVHRNILPCHQTILYSKNLQKIITIRINSFPIRIRKGINGFPYCRLRHAYRRGKQQTINIFFMLLIIN